MITVEGLKHKCNEGSMCPELVGTVDGDEITWAVEVLRASDIVREVLDWLGDLRHCPWCDEKLPRLVGALYK